MTIATSIPCSTRQPAGVDRLAQRLGLALVAWGERSINRPEASRADHQQQLAAQQLLSALDDRRATVTRRLF
jgi:hypothetical protein